MCLDNIAEARGERQEHGVDIGFVKEGRGDSNSGWNADLGGLSELALVTGFDVPFGVLLK